MTSVDVIVPCYRYGKYLRECVRSVLEQEGVDVRVLVIDDDSPDDTPAVCRALANEDSRVSFRRHDKNKGHIATYNEGIEWLQAKYYLLLSADDYLLPGSLARAAALMDSDDSVGFCFGAALEFHDDGRFLPNGDATLPNEGRTQVMAGLEFIEVCRRHGSINVVPTPTALVRTALQKGLGGYRSELPHSGDMELWMRLAAHAKVGYVSQIQAVYRRHETNMSLRYDGNNRMTELLQRKEAIDWMCSSCKHVLQDAPALRESLIAPLAMHAVGYASSALNNNDLRLFERYRELAVELDPCAARSWPWVRLHAKRLLGHRISTALLALRGSLS